MLHLTLQTIGARKARLVLTAMAVVIGVAFMTGTLVLTDTIRHSYDGIAATKLASTDAVVQARASVDTNGPDGTGTVRGTLPDSVVPIVRSVDGVAAVEVVVDGSGRLVGRDGKLVDDREDQATPIGMAWPAVHAFNPLHLVAGHAPLADGEIVIDRASARDGRFAPGDTVRVLTPSGTASYTVAGVAAYGRDDDAGGAGVVAFTPVTAARVLGEPDRVDSVRLLAEPGLSQADLAARVRAAVTASGHGTEVEVITGRDAVEQARDAAHQGMTFMSTFLLVFAVVALVVGGFVIFNAFSITAAQRTRETAVLRAIGASRRQVVRMGLLEAIILGIAASAVGAVLGIGLARGLFALLGSFGLELPGGSTVVTSGSVVTAIVVGTAVTLLAAYLPARRAGRVRPVAAMRDVAVDRSGSSRLRAVLGTVATVLGAGMLAAGTSGHSAGPVAGGALLAFAGVVALGPVIGPRVVRVLSGPVVALRGITGVLARDNAVRNPKRTAATASALTIGTALVVLISVFAASVRASVDANIDSALGSDWVITPLQISDGLSPSVAKAVDALPSSASVTTVRYAPATLDGANVEVTGIDPAEIQRHVDVGVRSGSVQALDAGSIGVLQRTATKNGWHLGDDVTLTFAESGLQHFTVAVIYTLKDPLGDYVISNGAFEANVAHVNDQIVFVLDAPGTSVHAARRAIDDVLGATPTARLYTPSEFKAYVAGQIDKLLNLIYVLLVLAVVIALFGVANTLALSVVERRRELGLLRAVGMQRRQVRASVRWESALIALLGTTTGAALGVGFAAAIVKALSTEGIDELAVPGVRIAAIVVAAVLAAVLAAALPARRAARLDVLEAINA